MQGTISSDIGTFGELTYLFVPGLFNNNSQKRKVFHQQPVEWNHSFHHWNTNQANIIVAINFYYMKFSRNPQTTGRKQSDWHNSPHNLDIFLLLQCCVFDSEILFG